MAAAMTTTLGEAASRRYREPPKDPRSKQARRLAYDLLDAPVDARREFLATLHPNELAVALTQVHDITGSPYGLWADTPSGFVEDVLGETVWSKQKQILDQSLHIKMLAVPSGFGTGKCVHWNAVIPLADGRMAKAIDLVGTDFEVMAWQEDGAQVRRKARAALNRVEPVYRVRTASGREIVRNYEHPLWCADAVSRIKGGLERGTVTLTPENPGWRPVGKIAEGDLVLVPEKHHAVGTRRVPDDWPALLGYMLGDGSTAKRNRPVFTQQDGAALDEFKAIVERLSCKVNRASHRPYDWEIKNATRARRPNAQGRMVRWSPMIDLMDEWGMSGKNATEKRLPGWAWTMPNDQLAVMLGRLFACDGWVTSRRTSPTRFQGHVGITLANEGLIRDVEAAMLRLGLWGRVRYKAVRYKGKMYDSWEWTLTDRAGLVRFADLIDMPGKNEALAELNQAYAGRGTARMLRWPTKNAPAGYRWEKVAEVEPMPDAQTVSIEVDEDHTFVTSFVEHNTWLAARAVAHAACTRPVGIFLAVTTATRFRQVRNLLWAKELRPLHAKAGLPGAMDQVEWKMPDRHGVDQIVAYGFTAVEGDDASFQGIHSAELLLVVDEAGGIAPGIGKNTRNVMTGNARMIAIGNPSADEGRTWFEDLCDQGEDDEIGEVETIRIRALDSPAITGEKVPCRACAAAELRPHDLSEHVVDQAWVDGTIRDYGEDHPYVISKVYAKFPKGSALLVIPPGWVDAGIAVEDPVVDGDKFLLTDNLGLEGETPGLVVAAGGWVRLGVDVAADGGDELVVSRAVGDLIHHRHISAGATNNSAVDVAEKVLAEIGQAQRLADAIGSKHRIRVKVDTVGLGWGVASMLERWGEISRHKADIVRVNVAESPEVDDEAAVMRPFKKRDELWLNGRVLLQPDPSTGVGRLRLRVDQKTGAQLSTPLQKPQGGFTRVERKVDMKKRGVSSPDRAEAALLAVYEPFPIRQRKRRGLLVG